METELEKMLNGFETIPKLVRKITMQFWNAFIHTSHSPNDLCICTGKVKMMQLTLQRNGKLSTFTNKYIAMKFYRFLVTRLHLHF